MVQSVVAESTFVFLISEIKDNGSDMVGTERENKSIINLLNDPTLCDITISSWSGKFSSVML